MASAIIFQKNLAKLENAGFKIIQPQSGDLACGYQGMGRMADVQKIVEEAVSVINQSKFLKGKKIIVTAGGTREEIDPVRFIGNHSSGKMGIALADAAFHAGAEVILISTVKTEKNYRVIQVESAQQMLEAVKTEFHGSDVLIMAAAVADYRPVFKSEHKIKKDSAETLTLELVKNPDILKEVSKIKTHNQVIIGFCAESENLINNAKNKIQEKNLDFIVANDISNPEIGFNSDYNAVSIINKSENITEIPKMTKTELAKIILEKIFKND